MIEQIRSKWPRRPDIADIPSEITYTLFISVYRQVATSQTSELSGGNSHHHCHRIDNSITIVIPHRAIILPCDIGKYAKIPQSSSSARSHYFEKILQRHATCQSQAVCRSDELQRQARQRHHISLLLRTSIKNGKTHVNRWP